MRLSGSTPNDCNRSSLNINIDNGVTMSRANSGDGTHWRIRAGVRKTTARVITPMLIAAGFGNGNSASVLRDPTTPPVVVTPTNGPSCRIKMMKPIPDMNPETTE